MSNKIEVAYNLIKRQLRVLACKIETAVGDFIPKSALGQDGGVATLGDDGLLTDSQRPPVDAFDGDFDSAVAQDYRIRVITITADYVLQLEDSGSTIIADTLGGNIQITLPTFTSPLWGIGFVANIKQYGTNTVSFVSSSNIRNMDGHTAIAGEYGKVTVERLNMADWSLTGETA